jgi:hypothetical protein
MTDSRQGPGLLTIGVPPAGVEVSTQASAVKLTPTVNSNDGTPTLATPDPAPETDVAWSLNVSAIQDFEDPAGFVNWLMDNALGEFPFTWEPLTGAAPVYSGVLQVVPIEVGGDVAVQVVTDVELPLVGVPTRDDTGVGGASSRSRKAAAE